MQNPPETKLQRGRFYKIKATLYDIHGRDHIVLGVTLPSGKAVVPIPAKDLFVGKYSAQNPSLLCTYCYLFSSVCLQNIRATSLKILIVATVLGFLKILRPYLYGCKKSNTLGISIFLYN